MRKAFLVALKTSVAVVTILALAAPVARAAEERARPTGAALRETLLPAYWALQQDTQLKALARALDTRMSDQAAVDAYLRRLTIPPVEYLEIDMEMKRYEHMVPRFIGEDWQRRWIELNEAKAREIYGDTKVDLVLSGWPANTGDDAADIELALRATVGTNRNVASTNSPAPLNYQGEIQIAVNPLNNNQMVAAANTWDTIGGTCAGGIQAVFYSSDGGATWGYTCPPLHTAYALGSCTGTVFGSDPAVYWNDANEVFLNHMMLCATASTTRYAMVVARSTTGGATWTAQGVIKNSWATGTLEDKNFYVIDNTPTSPFYRRHYTCWDRANNEKFAYSTTNGVSWTEVDLPTAPVGGIDLGCEIAVQSNGTVHVVWDSLACGVSTCTDERMWYTQSTNGGVSWSTPVEVRNYNLTGFSGTHCPQAQDNRCIGPFGAVDVDNSGGACNGTLYATFTDYSAGENVNASDIWVSRSTNNGATWSAPVKVNDDGIAGRVQFHPFLQVDQSNGNVVVVWHDARNSSTNRAIDYYASRSTNCGVSFEANTQVSQPSIEFNNSGISTSDSNTTDNPNRNPNQYGEYIGLDVKNGKAYVAWSDTRHFYPGSSTNTQKENLGFAVVDFSTTTTPVCGNNLREAPEVCDGTDLAGQTCVSQGFGGGTLSCNAGCSAFVTTACTVAPVTVTFTSVAAEDGRVVESSETSNVGGTATPNNSTTSAIRVGDTSADAQYKGFLSFNTASIPDGATIQSVTLSIRRGTSSGTNPFTTHGSLLADVQNGAFSGSNTLQTADFQAAATAVGVCSLSNAASNGTNSTCTFNAAGLAAINKLGTTQVRIYFALDDNDDLGNDYIGYYSGDNNTAANRPTLTVTYQ